MDGCELGELALGHKTPTIIYKHILAIVSRTVLVKKQMIDFDAPAGFYRVHKEFAYCGILPCHAGNVPDSGLRARFL